MPPYDMAMDWGLLGGTRERGMLGLVPREQSKL